MNQQQKISELKSIVEKIVLMNKLPIEASLKVQSPFKQTYKQIYDFFDERMMQFNLTEEVEDHRFYPSLVEFLRKLFGVSGVNDKRQKEFFLSLIKYKYNKKVNIFGRFLGMECGEANYSELEYRLYIESMHELFYQSKRVSLFFRNKFIIFLGFQY